MGEGAVPEWARRIAPWIATIAFVIFTAWLISGALERRGRWDLNEPIAAADRLLTGGPIYSAGDADAFVPSSPYFPGVTLVAYTARRIVGAGMQEEVLLITACVLVLLYFFLLVRVFRLIGGETSPVVAALAMMVASYFGFRAWVSYATEFKPDTAALLMATAAFIIVFTGRATAGRALAVFLACAMSLAFKQHSAALLAGLFLGIVFSSLARREKQWYAAAVFAAGVVSSAALLGVRNLVFFAIQAHRGRRRLGLGEFFFNQRLIGLELLLLAILIAVIAARRPRKARALGAEIVAPSTLRSYLVMCLPWLLIEIQSSLIVGGNAGNVATGLIPLSPVILLAMERLAGRRVLEPVVALLGVIAGAKMLLPTAHQIEGAAKYSRDETAAVAELLPYAGERAFLNGSSYVIARASGIRTVTELETAGHVEEGMFRGSAIGKLNERLKRREYDVVLCIPECAGLAQDTTIHVTPWYRPATTFRSALLAHSVMLPSAAR